jgi:DNA-binding transcriptional ArsR family regulator
MSAMLDVRRLLVLRAVAQHGSLAAAARSLGYTQPAVSHHLRRLEPEAGVRLLAQDGRGVRLTDAGRALAAAVRTGWAPAGTCSSPCINLTWAHGRGCHVSCCLQAETVTLR